jgi:hypothetical protein
MRALLVVQAGPGAGTSFALDPREQPVFSVGRSSRCKVCLSDQRASRHHLDVRWNGRAWEVTDQGSTNGTFVNGVQIHGVHQLQPGDHITLGETTMLWQELSSYPVSPPVSRRDELLAQGLGPEDRARREYGPSPRSPSKTAEKDRTRPAFVAAYWVIQALVAGSIVCLGAGAFLPWLQVTGSLAQDLQPLLQGLADVVASLSGQESILNVSRQIGGLEGYGKLTLLVALVSTIALLVDVFSRRRSVIPGIVYLLTSLMAGGAVAFDLVNYYRFYGQMQDLTLLFGVRLEQVVEVFDQFLDVSVTPMIGLNLTGLGLLLLLVGAVGRLGLVFFDRGR